MAPEIFMPGHRHGPCADFYALGITAFQVGRGGREDGRPLRLVITVSTPIGCPPRPSSNAVQLLVGGRPYSSEDESVKAVVRLAALTPPPDLAQQQQQGGGGADHHLLTVRRLMAKAQVRQSRGGKEATTCPPTARAAALRRSEGRPPQSSDMRR